MTRYAASVLTALILSSANANLLRTKKKDHQQRKLQLGTTVLNALIDEFTPDLSTWAQTELNYFDPLAFGNSTTVSLGDTTFDGACPDSFANITYGIGAITGISDVNINKIELISGTEDIDVSFLALEGATWNGDWLFDFSFPNITAETTVVMNASLCGFPVNQALTGSTTILDPAVVATVAMDGKTDNILLFRQSSQVTGAVVERMELTIGNVTADFGIDGDVVDNLNVAESLQQQLLANFSNDVEPLIINVVNVFLENLAPFALDGSSTSTVSKIVPMLENP